MKELPKGLKSLERWGFGRSEGLVIWKFGDLKIWRFEGLEVWRFGDLKVLYT